LRKLEMQKESPNDLELNLKKRARRRLVGAIALVLLMLIVLPFVLKDRAASQPQEQITISLPGEQPTTLPAAKPSDFNSIVVPATPVAQTPDAAPIADVASIADPEAASSQPEKQVPAKEIDPKEPAVKEAIVKDPAKLKPEASHKFYVQVGVFSDADNVKKLQGKLSDLGYKSQTEKITTDKGQKIRLRTQVFADRNEAAIALENIKDAGLVGMVVSQ
jgi:DedD protein